MKADIVQGDCIEVMAGMAENSIDACVTDPPYGLEFMGKEWDKLEPNRSRFKGKERKMIGPAKFKDFKALPNFASQKRNYKCATCGKYKWDYPVRKCQCETPDYRLRHLGKEQQEWHFQWLTQLYRILKPGAHLLAFGGTRTFHRMACAVEDAGFEIRDCITYHYGSGFPKNLKLPNGQGTALKPATELICLARKPLSEKTVAANVLKWGTGGMNIEGCRIAISNDDKVISCKGRGGFTTDSYKSGEYRYTKKGRWPANLIISHHPDCQERCCHPDCPVRMLDQQSGVRKSRATGYNFNPSNNDNPSHVMANIRSGVHFGDSGGVSRYFYCAKASSSERNKGMPEGERNNHPTVKPIALIEYLIKLVLPPGGLVIDSFFGSGTLGVACRKNGWNFIGIEKDEGYIRIARARLAAEEPKIWA